MAKNWAIVVGINQYEFLQPLNYAKRDAELMAQFLGSEAGFEQVFLFSDSSPEIGGKSTRPFRANLLRLFREIFETPFMGDGDNFWFFFAGHGIRHADRDYLMPLDGDPHDIENTGIPTNFLTERLRRCGADNVVMLLDACRNTGSRAGQGIGTQTAEEARQTGVISIFACSPNQFSHEAEAIQQGAFTHALLEGLGIRGRCATVERLNQYLEHRVPEILRECSLNVRQTPYTIAEPANRSNLILMPRYASLAEIAVLKNDAYQAEVSQDWALAERLWIRVLSAAAGQDMEAVKGVQRIAQIIKQSNFLLNAQTAQSTGIEANASAPIGPDLPHSQVFDKNLKHPIHRRPRLIAGITGMVAAVLAVWGISTLRSSLPLPSGLFPDPATLPDANNPPTSQTGILTATATQSFRQGDLRKGQEATEALLDQNNLVQATSAIDAVPNDKQTNPAISFLRGRVVWQSLQQRGNQTYTTADVRRYWKTAVNGKPEPLYYNALGFAYYAEGDLKRAGEAWKTSAKLAAEQQKLGATASTGKVNPALNDEMTAYAGTALAYMKTANQQPPDQQAGLKQQAIILRNRILRQTPNEFQPNVLAENWLWTESAIAEWKALLAAK